MPDFIEPKNLAAARSAGRDVLVLDVRSPAEYAAGHVGGALNVPMEDLRPFTRTLKPNTKIVAYCTMAHPGGSRGEAAADLLTALGLDAKTLAGGLPAWQGALLPVETDDETPTLEIQLEETR